jgi:prepilin-type N-terminal cleavage/methylation domain-containing protein/prepilin-type processing-associated H-X9-DG protein
MTLLRPRVSSSAPIAPARRNKGFTLVELLVVIGIIALLISILLPTLASARRAANSTKCLASLKEIGNAFSMYAMDNKGYYPAVRDKVNQYTANGQVAERRWTDLLAKYFHKKGDNFQTNAELTQIRINSVLWGCPEWTKTFQYNANAGAGSADHVYNGYGMQYYPSFPEKAYSDATNAFRSTPTRVGYFKQGYWARRGSDRLIVADSQQDIIALPSSVALASPASYTGWAGFNNGTTKWWPYAPATLAATDFGVDARHQKPGLAQKGSLGIKSVNGLFADGHAQSVNVREAFNGIRNPGQDSTNPVTAVDPRQVVLQASDG